MNDVKNSWSQWLTTGLLVAAAFVIGMLFSEVRYLRNGAPTPKNAVADAGAGAGNAAPSQPLGNPEDVKPVEDTEHIRGNKDAKITLIEYSDFECPFCARFHPTMVQIMEDYGDDVRWVYRHYPLGFHPNAQKAAEASECVVKVTGRPDAFWEFADKIFEENNKLGGRLDATSATTVATSMGVDVAAFKTCLDSGEMSAKVKAQMDDGTAAGITGTPGTIILTQDGQAELIPGAVPFEQAKAAVDKYL